MNAQFLQNLAFRNRELTWENNVKVVISVETAETPN